MKTMSDLGTLSCVNCGRSHCTLRRFDRPLEGYVCSMCIRATRSAVVKIGKERVLVGGLAERYNELRKQVAL